MLLDVSALLAAADVYTLTQAALDVCILNNRYDLYAPVIFGKADELLVKLQVVVEKFCLDETWTSVEFASLFQLPAWAKYIAPSLWLCAMAP